MKAIKKLVGLGLVMALAVGVVGCSSGSSETKLDQIKSNGKLVVGLSPDYPPFEFPVMENGKEKIQGVDPAIGEAIAKEIGVKVEIKKMDFDGLIGAVNSDKIDIVLSAMSPSPDRVKTTDFSDLYFETKNVVLVKKDFTGKIESGEDLKKLKVGVQRGSIQEQYVRNELKVANSKSLAAVTDLALDLKNGNIDAIVVNDLVGNITAKQYNYVKVANSSVGGDVKEGMAAAIKKADNNKEFVELVNKVIKDMKDSGQFDKTLDEMTTLASKSAQ
ncbi:MAG: transporter substrate-binding domain-containing protein [Clostridioides sp.]|nr:transporter substrate-binding domain-containing protein [Clostridioides sp.]